MSEPIATPPPVPTPGNALPALPAASSGSTASTNLPSPGEASPDDRSGAESSQPDPSFIAKIERAATAATEQFLSESKKRRPGQRGPDKKPRKLRSKPVPLGEMGNGTGETPLEEGAAEPLEAWAEPPAPFDEATAQTLVDIACGLLNDGAAALVQAVAKKETGDEKLAVEAGAHVRMSEKVEACVRKGAMECAKKYSVRLDYAPEIMLCGGLLLWAGQISMTLQTLRKKGVELRNGQKVPSEASE